MKLTGNLRWCIAWLLFLATMINYIDRQVLSLLAPMLRDLFGMSNTDYSRVIFAFLVAYMIMQTWSGKLMDRLGVRRGFTITVIFWSAAAMLHAAANSALFLGFSRFLLGLGEAGNWPGAVKAISVWFPAKERAAAIGFFNSGSIAGAIVAQMSVPLIALHLGWRATFVLTGALGLIWLIPWLLLYRSPSEHPRITASELKILGEAAESRSSSVPATASLGRLMRDKQVWSILFARMLADPVWWFYAFWLPEYLRRARGFSMEMIAYFAWIPFLASGIGSLLGGSASGWLIQRGWPVLRARKVVMLLCAFGMLGSIPAVLSGSSVAALALISLVTFSKGAWASNVFTLPADIFPRGVVASVSGISGTGAAIGGMVFTLVTGFTVDHFSYVPIFVAAALMPFAAMAILHAGVRSRPAVPVASA